MTDDEQATKDAAAPGANASKARPEVTGGIEALIPPEWFSDRANSSIWMRIHTCLFTPLDAVTDAFAQWEHGAHALPLGAPTMLAIGTVRDFKAPVQAVDIYSQVSGQVVVALNVSEKVLPDAIFVFLATPFAVDGVIGKEAAAKRHLDLVAALICAHTGRNFMWDCIFEGEMSAQDGKMSVPGEGNKMPQPIAGPFLGKQNGMDVAEIAQRLKDTPEPKKGRIQLALRLLNGAMRENEGFLEYWTALEVVCDGKTNRIKDRIAQIYRVKSQQDAGRLSGLTALSVWRGEYVHKGIAPKLTTDVERYLELLFLDLLRYELGLTPRGHAGGMQQAKGYDLSPLGLADNRTEEQRAARRAMEDMARSQGVSTDTKTQ